MDIDMDIRRPHTTEIVLARTNGLHRIIESNEHYIIDVFRRHFLEEK